MDIKTKKVKKFSMYALYFLSIFLLPMTTSMFTNCNGKAFQCLNSTHFMLCIDIGNGVSIPLKEYQIPCPEGTECYVGNDFQCVQVQSTTVTSDVTNELQRIMSAEDTIQDDKASISFVSERIIESDTVDTLQRDSVTTRNVEQKSAIDTTTENFRLLSDTTTIVYVKQFPTDNQIEHSLNPVEVTTSQSEVSPESFIDLNTPENTDIKIIESTSTTVQLVTATTNAESFDSTTENENYTTTFEDVYTSTFEPEIETVTESNPINNFLTTNILTNTETTSRETQATPEWELTTETDSNLVKTTLQSSMKTDNNFISTIADTEEILTPEASTNNNDINEYKTFVPTEDLTYESTTTEMSTTIESTITDEYDTLTFSNGWITENPKDTTQTTSTYEMNLNLHEDTKYTESFNYITTDIVTNPNTQFQTITQTGIFDETLKNDKTTTRTTINDLNDNEISTTIPNENNQNNLEFKPFTEISNTNIVEHHTTVVSTTEKNNFFDEATTSFNSEITYTEPFITETNSPINNKNSEVNEETTTIGHSETSTQKIEQNTFDCVSEGRFADYVDNNIYYICVKGKDNNLYKFKFQCRIGYFLDKSSVKCFKNELSSESPSTYVSTASYDEASTQPIGLFTKTPTIEYTIVSKKVAEKIISSKAYNALSTTKIESDLNSYTTEMNSPKTTVESFSNSATTFKSTEFICNDEGRFVDNYDNNVYYICVKGKDDKLYKFKFKCQIGYYLDRDSIKCFKNVLDKPIESTTEYYPKETADKKVTNEYTLKEKTLSTNEITSDSITQTTTPFADTLSTVSLRNSERLVASVTPKYSEFVCLKEGRFLDSLNSNVYYICVKGKDNKLYKFKFLCQIGYYLDKNNIKCIKDVYTSSSTNSWNTISTTESPIPKFNSKQNMVESATTEKPKAFVCTNEGRFYDNFVNNVYYICVKGKDNKLYGFKYKCQIGYYLDKAKVKCLKDIKTTTDYETTIVEEKSIYTTTEQYNKKSDQLNSIQTEDAFNCIGKEHGTYSDIKDCSKFYTCINNKLTINYCPNKTVFSELEKKCVTNLSHCVRNNIFQCTAEGRFSDIKKDDVYYICVKGKDEILYKFQFQCKLGYVLDKNSVKCVIKS